MVKLQIRISNARYLALGGVDISSDVYAWVIVLVLPINSAVNPFIYTFSMIYRQQY